MAVNPLKIYLRDHLAGSRSALKLLQDLRRNHAGDEIGALADKLYREISEDRATLRAIGKRVGVRRSLFKEAGGEVIARLLRIKLRRFAPGGFEAFQKLEALSLGIEGKKMLWRVLARSAETDSRLAQFDYSRLQSRATSQREKVDSLNLALSAAVLIPRS